MCPFSKIAKSASVYPSTLILMNENFRLLMNVKLRILMNENMRILINGNLRIFMNENLRIFIVATGITKVAKSPFTLHPHLLRKVVTLLRQQILRRNF